MINFKNIQLCKDKCKIAIFPGSFNPIHFGHLNIERDLIELEKFKKVIFVPSGKYHHKKDLIDENFRLEMLQISTKLERRFEICDFELNQNKFISSDITVKHIIERFDSSLQTAKLFFVLGGDMLPKVLLWPTLDKLVENVFLLLCKRPAFDLNSEIFSHSIPKKAIDRLYLFEPKQVSDLSSNKVRTLIKEEDDIKSLVPKEVVKYINSNKLYR